MDNTIFKKLGLKSEMNATILYAPLEYPDYKDFRGANYEKSDFVHLFVSSRAEFKERFALAASAVVDGGLLWISYPKSSKKQEYDINRDSLWGLVLSHGWHPVSQASLGDQWSAVRLKRNEPGASYERPSNVKKLAGEETMEQKKKVIIPEELIAVMNTDSEAKAFFDSLTDGYKRGYCDWVGGARQAPTRQSRADKALIMLQNKQKTLKT